MLGTYIAASLPRPDIVIFVCVALHLLGVMLYIMVIVLVFDRWMFFELPPEMLSPSYWINAGALAITTLAGVRLIASGVGAGRLDAGVPRRQQPALLGHRDVVDSFVSC